MSLCGQTSFKCIIGSLEGVDKDGRSHAALKIQTTPSSVPLPMPKILGLSHRRAVPLTIPGFLLVRTRVLFQHPLQPDPIATMYTALGPMRLVGSRTVRGHQKWERHQAEKTGDACDEFLLSAWYFPPIRTAALWFRCTKLGHNKNGTNRAMENGDRNRRERLEIVSGCFFPLSQITSNYHYNIVFQNPSPTGFCIFLHRKRA